MKVVTSHIGADFDSLASMVAASRLHPESVLCFSGSASRNVREFLKRYAGRWPVLTPRRVPLEDIRTLIAVDVRSRSRLGAFAAVPLRPGVRVFVYDHHPPVSDPIPAEKEHIERVGATTTLLVELLIAHDLPISPQEASLYAMGIYEDTGMLTAGNTCRRDYMAVARLREFGADLSIITSHIEMNLNARERSLLDQMMENSVSFYLRGVQTVFSKAESSGYVEGISLFVHRLRDSFDADVAIAAVAMAKRTYIVARSREGALDVAKLLQALGGGGHPQAAAATLYDVTPDQAIETLRQMLDESISPGVSLGDVMSAPVMAVDITTSVEEARRVMTRYGHAALPVVRDDALAGLVTRKDLDKAKIHGLGGSAVGDYMTESVLALSPEAPVSEAHRTMVLHNIGRIPIVREGRLEGIVTRTDILRALYPASIPAPERAVTPLMPWEENVTELLAQRLLPWVFTLLKRLGLRAEELGARAFVAGGFVRDLLLERPTLDLDVVIEGDAIAFLESWRADGCRVAVHTRFSTGTIVFPGGRKVDVATARREFYEYPVAPPKVRRDSIKHDLSRRDYAVNAMAISITPSSWGTLADYFGGRRDIQRRILRVLHPLSFVEDPTRVLRGIRIEQRLHLRFEDATLRLLKNCVQGGLLSLLSGVRLRSELELVFQEKAPYPAVRRLGALGVWEMVFPGVRFEREAAACFRRLAALLRHAGHDFPDFGGDLWFAFFAALLFGNSEASARSAIDRLRFADRERELVEQALFGLSGAERFLDGAGAEKTSALHRTLHDAPPVVTLFWAAATSSSRVRKRTLLYMTRLHKIVPMLTGRDIIDLGCPRGPLVGTLLHELLRARLDGELETRDEEEMLARRLLACGSLPRKRRDA